MNDVTRYKYSVRDVSYDGNVKPVDHINSYDCEIRDDVFIGPFMEIQSDKKISPRTKIRLHSFIGTLVTIGDDCFK